MNATHLYHPLPTFQKHSISFHRPTPACRGWVGAGCVGYRKFQAGSTIRAESRAGQPGRGLWGGPESSSVLSHSGTLCSRIPKDPPFPILAQNLSPTSHRRKGDGSQQA